MRPVEMMASYKAELALFQKLELGFQHMKQISWKTGREEAACDHHRS